MQFLSIILALWALATPALAQFNFFDQMFGGGGEQHHQGHQHQQPQNAASDSAWYKQNYEAAHCDKYLCPHTLSCVHFPHHCPCAFPEVEDKVELGDGSMVCVSKGGYKAGEAMRKIELARKGLL
ncbi:long chronological lifespan protein 2 [Myriangium duriaei CBS 260.36]|uniref:Long chronological lifespan protein 2 n=1 Tax=Myriangium duriaei CBS 260.36 TaxID=1168546 RepID=A0A9P4J139_9PEZI|nr:long chronological lifespan protein 2 [Myriangium duriaei CBS 260.36]